MKRSIVPPGVESEPLSTEDLRIERLGEPKYSAPNRLVPVHEDDAVVAFADWADLKPYLDDGREVPLFEPAGPRAKLFFDPARVTCGIVTCGGLCPGLNDVIRSIYLTLRTEYGVKHVLAFRYGYAGLGADAPREPVLLTPELVDDIHEQGGTVIGSSRGAPTVQDMVDTLVDRKVDVLFTIGGDGTLRGAAALCDEIARRGLKIAIIGIPKTIDNDLHWVERSFGFATAVHEARSAIMGAHVEARGAWNGVGLVKLMGRHSGFIAAHASLANSDVNVCLVPEVPFALGGEDGFLAYLERRLEARRHAVVVVAEGAGQDLLAADGAEQRDASGNVKLKDIGVYLRDEITSHFKQHKIPISVKYIDPSYMIRSLPANSIDSELCLILGQHAAHAAMAGRTRMLVGYWNQRYTHIPLALAVRGRKQLDPQGELWQSVLWTTDQPANLGA